MFRATLIGISSCCVIAPAIAQPLHWLSPVDGMWEDAGNWSPAVVPTILNDYAFIGQTGSYTVEMTSSRYISGIALTNPEAQLNLEAGVLLRLHGGGIINEGNILVNPRSTTGWTTVHFTLNDHLSGSGTLRLNGTTTLARVTAEDGIVVTHAAEHTIRGFGQVSLTLDNRGLIAADVEDRTLDVLIFDSVNSGKLRAESGGILYVGNVSFVQQAEGAIEADGGAVRIGSSNIESGRITNTEAEGSLLEITGEPIFARVLVEGPWTLLAGRDLTIHEYLINHGELTVNPANTPSVTSMHLPLDAHLLGAGSVRLNGSEHRARITADAGARLFQSPKHSIFGFGMISAEMINDGTVLADQSGENLKLTGPTKFNNAFFAAENGGVLFLSDTTVDQSSEGVIEAREGQVTVQDTTIIGGILRSTDPVLSAISMTGAVLEDLVIEGEWGVVNGGATITGGTLINNGLCIVNPLGTAAANTLTASGNTTISGDGEIRLNGNAVRSRLLNAEESRLTLGPGQLLTGIGQIQAATHIQGTLAPGLDVGTMTATRDVTLDKGATVICEIGQCGSDRFETSSTIALDGSLHIALADGFDASAPDVYEIISADGGVLGRFSLLTGDTPVAPLVARVVYEPNRVRLGFVCPADANLDGATDLADLNAVLANYGTNARLGDVTGDGTVDLADLNLVLANFGTDCTD